MNGHPPARLVGLMLLGLPAAARAQDRWERAVGQYLAQAEHRLHEAGYTTAASQVGALNTEETAAFNMTLERPGDYVLAGVCDPDCVDLQLALFAPNGYEVDAARSLGSAPIVRIDPRETGVYRVQVTMARCTTNPCHFGVGVFRKQAR